VGGEGKGTAGREKERGEKRVRVEGGGGREGGGGGGEQWDGS
jgi:hypothetical protein